MHRIALVPYRKGWSYDLTAQALRQHLSERFDLRIFHDETISHLSHHDTDLIVDFWWKGALTTRYGQRVVKQVSSHRWGRDKYGSLTVERLASDHLRRANAVLVPSRRLLAEIAPATERPVALCPKGFHPETFGDYGMRRGDLTVGWAGSASATDKNVPMLIEAWSKLYVADACLTQPEMPDFYNSIDVITCASDAEGDPRPLIEGMACGCFPVVVDVGIVPELVRHGENGLVVARTPEAFAAAFAWCREHVDLVRAAGRRNAEEMRATRTWKQCAQRWGDALEAAVDRAPPWKVNDRMERIMRVKAALRQRRAARRL